MQISVVFGTFGFAKALSRHELGNAQNTCLRVRQAKNSAIRRRLASGGIARIYKLSKPTTRALPGRPVPATGTHGELLLRPEPQKFQFSRAKVLALVG